MSATAQTANAISKMLARLLFGAFMSKSEGPKALREVLGKIREWLGSDPKAFFAEMENVHISVASACADEVILGALSDESKKRIASLPIEERATAEMIYARLTGKFERSEGQWVPGLWRLRKVLDEYVIFSPTQIKKEELAPFVREISIEWAKLVREHILKILD